MIVPVVLSGGAGTRLWPLSRPELPKQFLPVVGDESMLVQTVRRLDGLSDLAPPIVVSSSAHTELVASQLPEATIISEPYGRNTAPALAAAATSVPDDPILVVLPSDHTIDDVEAFHQALGRAVRAAEDGWLVTFGVVPHRPATGYGYISPGPPLSDADEVRRVDRFVEKPDEPSAAEYVAGGYLWNSGMFVMRASAYLAELESHRPDVAAAVAAAVFDGAIEAASWAVCPAVSIDVAVMEQTNRAAVVPLDAGWNDLGSWPTLLELGEADEAGNVISGDVWLLDSKGSYVRSTSRLVAAVGLTDLIVVETPDAVLVVHRDQAEAVRDIAERFEQRSSDTAG